MAYIPPLGNAADFLLGSFSAPLGNVASFEFAPGGTYLPPRGDGANFELTRFTPPAGNAVNFEFIPEVASHPFLIGFEVLGQLGKANVEDPLGVFGIYQRRHTRKGVKVGKMAFYPYVITHTSPQQANREKFAAAQAAWMSLTPEEKSVYTKRAKKRGMFGWGLFIREYYQLV